MSKYILLLWILFKKFYYKTVSLCLYYVHKRKAQNKDMENKILKKQEVLRLLWEATNAFDVMEIFVKHPAARDPSLIEELRKESNNAAEALAKHLLARAEDLDGIRNLILEFLKVDNLDKLVNWHSITKYTFTRNLRLCMEAFFDDKSDASTALEKTQYRIALSVSKELEKLLMSLQTYMTSKQHNDKFFEQNPLLCSSAIDRWLELRSKVDNEDTANVKRVREFLVIMCKMEKNFAEIRKRKPKKNSDEKVNIPRPSRWFESEHWYLLHPPLNDQIDEVINQNLTTRPPELVDVIEKAVLDFADKEFHVKDQDFLLAYTYCYLLSCGASEIFSSVFPRYECLIDKIKTSALPNDHKATAILRYGMAVLRTKIFGLPEKATLIKLTNLMNLATEMSDSTKSPKLVRDLHFTKARANELLYKSSEAVEDYRKGLRILGAEHELEPRAMALNDLANTLSKLPQMDEKRDIEITALYDEGISILKNTASPDLSAKLLLNAAIYQSERTFNDMAINAERAISYILQAREITSKMLKQFDEEESEIDLVNRDVLTKTRILHGTICMTYGNLLKSREYGSLDQSNGPSFSTIVEDQSPLVQISKLYEEGLSAVKDIPCELQGFLQFNLGNLYVDLYEITNQDNYLQRAMYAYDAADSLFTDERYKFRVIVQRANIELLATDSTLGQISDSVTNIQSILPGLTELSIPSDVARAQHICGLLYKKRFSLSGELHDLDSSVSFFTKALNIYKTESNPEAALTISRRLTGCLMARFFKTHNKSDLLETEKILKSATQLIDFLWNLSNSIEWHRTIAMQYGDLFADLAWCQFRLERNVSVLRLASCQAKARELFQTVSALPQNNPLASSERRLFLEQLRKQARSEERTRWELQEKASSEGSIIAEIEKISARMEKNSKLHSLISPPELPLSMAAIESQLAMFYSHSENTIIIDYTISRWGGFAITRLADGEFTSIAIDLNSIQLQNLLLKEGSGWLWMYYHYRDAVTLNLPINQYEERLQKWEEKQEEIIHLLSEKAVRPLASAIAQQLPGSTLIICPGSLVGLPLHAAAIAESNGQPLFRLVQGFAYALSTALLPQNKPNIACITQVLCILADPGETDEKVLKTSQREIVEISSLYAQQGRSVSLIASVRQLFGKSALARHLNDLHPAVRIIEERATPEWLAKNIEKFDMIFYSGHGISSGLVLSDDTGKSKIFSIEDALTMPALSRAPIVHLSACETAHENASVSGEVFSFASWLLRAGSKAVIASSWDAIDRWSTMFSIEFHQALQVTNSLTASYQQAVCKVSSVAPHKVDWCNFMLYLGR